MQCNALQSSQNYSFPGISGSTHLALQERPPLPFLPPPFPIRPWRIESLSSLFCDSLLFLWWPDFCQTMSLVRVQTWEASFLGLFPCNHEINLNTAVKDPRSLSSLLLLRSSSLEWSGEKYRTTMVSRNRNKIQCGQSRLHLFLFLCWLPPSLLAIVNAPTYSAAGGREVRFHHSIQESREPDC